MPDIERPEEADDLDPEDFFCTGCGDVCDKRNQCEDCSKCPDCCRCE